VKNLDLLTTDQVAELAGITAASVRTYLWRGTISEPDIYLGRTPYWHRATITRWLATRPSVGRSKPDD
jgi:hypothetical protein